MLCLAFEESKLHYYGLSKTALVNPRKWHPKKTKETNCCIRSYTGLILTPNIHLLSSKTGFQSRFLFPHKTELYKPVTTIANFISNIKP